jgi:hypothetical protein
MVGVLEVCAVPGLFHGLNFCWNLVVRTEVLIPAVVLLALARKMCPRNQNHDYNARNGPPLVNRNRMGAGRTSGETRANPQHSCLVYCLVLTRWIAYGLWDFC